MSIDVKCRLNKTIYYNYLDGYKVVSCIPLEKYIELDTDSKYKNFTISGYNLNNYSIGKDYFLKLDKDENSKYSNSYKVIGLGGITNFNTDISYETSFQVLKGLMSEKQAENILSAYPNFITLILSDKADQINVDNIKNVGEYRLQEYIKKVYTTVKDVEFFSLCTKWELTQLEQEKAQRRFETAEEFSNAINENPYDALIKLGKSFNKADKIILKEKPEYIDSIERCVYSCYNCLKINESNGNTKMLATQLFEDIVELTPECVGHIKTVVEKNERIYYDDKTKIVALLETYLAEKNIAEHILNRLEKENNRNTLNWEKYTIVDGFDLTKEQSKILQLACKNNVCLLNGVGGSGKTSSIKALVQMLAIEEIGFTLLAPTGIAAKRLREATGYYASTIHLHLLSEMIANEYVIIDESSMVGVHLLSLLLDTLPKDCKIIFIADVAQFASISCGNIIQDIIDSNVIPTVTLTKVFRYGIGGISTIATDFRTGKIDHLENEFSDYHYITKEENGIQQILEVYQSYIDKKYNMNDILILCPYNIGEIGSININKTIQRIYNENGKLLFKNKNMEFHVGDRVLNTKNRYNISKLNNENTCIYNGSLGSIIDYKYNENDELNLIVNFDGESVIYPQKFFGSLSLGWCISTHKSQGSEAKVVIIILDKTHERLLSRNLLYVAVSRAKEKLVIIGDKGAIKNGLKNIENKKRLTFLKKLLDKS